MAAPMKDRGLKICCLCNVGKKRCIPLSGNKARIANCKQNLENFISPVTVSPAFLDLSVICDPCNNFVSTALTYKRNLISSISTFMSATVSSLKRPAKTPPSALRRHTVAEQITKSVEKLEQLTLSSAKVCKKIHFSDHEYSKEHSSDRKSCDYLDPSLIFADADSCVYSNVYKEIDRQVTELSVYGESILFTIKDVESITTKHIFNAVVHEMHSKCPILLHCLSNSLHNNENIETKVATIATIYGMIMHSRNNKASAVQRIYSALALRYHADNELMSRLNKIHLTLSAESKRNVVREFGDHLEVKLIADLATGKTGKLNGDNLDIRVNTNDIRIKNKDKDYHFFASSFIIDRVDTSDYSSETPAVDAELHRFLPSMHERQVYSDSLKVLLSRVLIENIPAFSWMSQVFHIPHPFSNAMALKSTIHMLPVSLNNEVSYEGCVHIMDEYVQMINKWYTKAGRGGELENLTVPVGGDQLTRCRLQGAKSLRAGAHTRQERFQQLFPIVVELFHIQQDFLDKACKKFLKLNKGRDTGTLAHLKVIIQRVNVNGQVKARFKAHEDFTKLVGIAYFLDFVMEKFGMKTLNDEPCHPLIPANIKQVHKEKKAKVASAVLDYLIKGLLIQCDIEDHTDSASNNSVRVKVSVGGSDTELDATVKNGMVCLDLLIDEKRTCIQIPEMMVKQRCTLTLPNVSAPIVIHNIGSKVNELEKYVMNFLQWFFIMIQFTDAIHEGDVFRTNIIIKHMIPFFYSHSCLSKYLVECIDYILKTEIVLPPAHGMRVRAASFVNLHGGRGNNKAADLQKENEVKYLKELIKGLGANKTEQSIISISKATPIIMDVVSNFDAMLNVKKKTTSHKKRSSEDDLNAMLNVLRKVGIWKVKEERSLLAFKGISRSPFNFNRSLFTRTVENIIDRLQRDLPNVEDDSENDEE